MQNVKGDVQSISARVLRVDVAKWRLAQFLIPIATIASVAARRIPGIVPTVSAFLILAATGVVLLIARRSFGRRQIQFAAGKILIGNTDLTVRSSDVSAWTYDRNTGRLYGKANSWRLVVRDDDGDNFRSALASIFGKPRLLRHRGSRRARIVALGVALLGGGILAVGISMNIVATVFVGVPCLVFGLATLGAFSQKIVD
ncbi:MAG TPA: hypothetical protein VGJ26_12115 [Pirellulales bacterium]|jgi:hypothetical protein